MCSSFDRTGFPLLSVPGMDLAVQLLPVTKVQFERFLAEPDTLGDAWYEEILSVNRRVSFRRFDAGEREGLFLSGILPEEALAFARWLGKGFDLPTVAEWRVLYGALARQPAPRSFSQWGSGPARVLLEGLAAQLRPRTLLDLSLMRGGVVEWVRRGDGWAGLGAPRPAFQPNLWNPLADEVRPLRPGERLPYFGFRLVQRRSAQ